MALFEKSVLDIEHREFSQKAGVVRRNSGSRDLNRYTALEGNTVELEITCKVDPAKKSEAKSLILERAHFSMMDASRAHGKNGSAGP